MSEIDGNLRFMVEFNIPEEFTLEMTLTIPAQRQKVDAYFYSGKLLSYTLSSNRHKLWAVFVCPSEAELVSLVEKLPMTVYLDYHYYEVLFHEMTAKYSSFSLN
jgi:hypothetical protein